MPLHDRYARLTPYEVGLPSLDFADERFPALEGEADRRSLDLADPGVMLLLEAGVEILQELRGPGNEDAEGYQYGAFLFHAFHFWKQGRPLYLVEVRAARHLVSEGPGTGEWTPERVPPAGYAQLPQHFLWAVGGGGQAPESVDGFFWSAPDPEHFSLLVAMGMVRGRAGFSVVPLLPLPLRTLAEWASLTVRPDGRDFASSLPGAELEGLHAVETGGEVMKLAARLLWYLETRPEALVHGEAGGAEAGEPPPSALPYRRVRGPDVSRSS